ncbi:uncharacterized protein [Paralichthys olivaceus]|uniref:uncharacterized protein n=1 Tax=Paralichthys olivaceus TaxID=8255 RepID=UPI003753C241
MGQKLKVLPAEASCGEAVMGIGWDEPVDILIKHCRDMKQQETRLRLISLLLLLGCSAFYVFTTCAELRKREHSGVSEQNSSGEQRSPEPHQDRLCTAVSSTDSAENKSHAARLHIRLRSVSEDSRTDEQRIKWDLHFSSDIKYDEEKRAVVIPKSAVYFLYIRVSLICPNINNTASFNKFIMHLSSWSKDYMKNPEVLDRFRDGISCSREDFRNVFVGDLFDLSEGDHVSVLIKSGYELIEKFTFGAYLV